MRLTIQTKIVALSLSGLALSIALLGGISTQFISQITTDNAQKFFDEQAKNAHASVDELFFKTEQYIFNLALGIQKQIPDAQQLKDSTFRRQLIMTFFPIIKESIQNQKEASSIYIQFRPEISSPTAGFYMLRDFEGQEMRVSHPFDLSMFQPDDPQVSWFYNTLKAPKAIWAPPHLSNIQETDVISYTIPLFNGKDTIGVLGMDVFTSSLTKIVSSFRFFKTGYAYLETPNYEIIYHPTIARGKYFESGIDLKTIQIPLSNGMRLSCVAPLKEIFAHRNGLVTQIIAFSAILLLIISTISILISRSITRPLKILTESANRLISGDMSVQFNITLDDEIGDLSRSFSAAKESLQTSLQEAQGMAYCDVLTGIRNSRAFDMYIREMESKVQSNELSKFGIVMLDLNNLKKINDTHGHDMGNAYLINSTKLICATFVHSPVFRIGGDEFAVFLKGNDLLQVDRLVHEFLRQMDNSQKNEHEWERLSTAFGIAIYNKEAPQSIHDLIVQADVAMYEKKKAMKGEKNE